MDGHKVRINCIIISVIAHLLLLSLINFYHKPIISHEMPEILVVQLVKSYIQKETTTQVKRIKSAKPNLSRESTGDLILKEITSIDNNAMEANKKIFYPTANTKRNAPLAHSTTYYILSTHFDYTESDTKLIFDTTPLPKHEAKNIATNELLLYQQMIKRKINNNLIYPQLARKKGVEGKVGVGFLVLKDGQVRNITVQNSTNSILNQAAISTIKHASPFSPIPDTLGIEELRLSLIISFKLK